jgi:hypothetical protein
MFQLKKYYLIILLFFYCFFIPATEAATAQEYKAKYNAEYFPSLSGDSQVKLNIKIINLRSDVYVKEFGLVFPNSFAIENIITRDDYGDIKTDIENQERSFKIKLIFSSPNTGKNSENNFYLSFLQKNLFKVSDNVWEVMLPVIADSHNSIFMRFSVTIKFIR